LSTAIGDCIIRGINEIAVVPAQRAVGLSFFDPAPFILLTLHYNVLRMIRRPVAILILCMVPFILIHAQPSPLPERAAHALAITNGTLQVPGLKRPVTVQRDRWGVAHIYAQNQHDLFFAQGVVASQDRLF